MWIDAICINQLGKLEKGPYVAIRGDINRLTASMVVWLGP